ncbi:MAG: hypothetical protein HY821_15910 [Acidobacteria bacterium]|nr:hypothetical protein [Acidobacteriota bacterium]
MNSETAIILLAVSVTISSVSLLVSAVSALGLYRTVKKLHSEVAPLIPQAQATLAEAKTTMTETLAEVRSVTERARSVLDLVEAQVQGIDRARTELSTHLNIQGERREIEVEDILGRTQEVVGVVHGSVLRPVREVTGMVAGVKAALQALITGRRPTVDRATQDDEMFI